MAGGRGTCWIGLVAALAGGVFCSGAAGQSVWLTGTIGAGSSSYNISPPALVFDSQDRPQVVYDTGNGYLQHIGGNGAGGISTWSPAVTTGISSYSYTGPGQIYLARSGSQIYLGFRSLSVGPVARMAVFDGAAWGAYTLSWPGSEAYPGYPNLYGLIIDTAGQSQWLINTEKAVYAPDGSGCATIPMWGYYLVGQTGPSTVAATPIALGTGGGAYTGLVADKVFYQGGQALLDRFGILHTIQYYARGGTLLYAKGPLAGPFEVSDNLERGWDTKMGRPTLTVDPSGAAHIVYTQQWPGFGLKHLTWTGSGWDSEWIERGGNVSGLIGTFPKILVDRMGVLHVIYADAMHGVIKHASKTQGTWQIETIDQVGMQVYNKAAAGMLAAAMDSQGGIGVVYWDAANLVFKYAYRMPSDQTPVSMGLPAVEVTNQ